MGLKKVFLLVAFCLSIISYCGCRSLPEDDALNILNKPPILTFEQHGEVIDCVNMFKQPAFENPLLKNHSVQIKPNFEIYPERDLEEHEVANGSKKCPDGTVPIRRTTSDDLLRQKSLPRFGLDFSDPADYSNPKFHVAAHGLKNENMLGARANVGVHNPSCYGDQMTGAFIGISNAFPRGQDYVCGGWMKSPNFFGDDGIHIAIYWANRAQGKGCFNLLCPGFVQVDQTVRPGDGLSGFSVFEGDTREVKIGIQQDPQTKNWWFIFQGRGVGYWPKELFSGLDHGAGYITFGGVAITDGNNVSPQMGFGAFPGESGKGNLMREAGFMRFINFGNASGEYLPSWRYRIHVVNCQRCYNIADTGPTKENGYLITFGGPGGGNCINE